LRGALSIAVSNISHRFTHTPTPIRGVCPQFMTEIDGLSLHSTSGAELTAPGRDYEERE
jgi:hypothetical protein